MGKQAVKISGVGCSLLDYIYTNVDFENDALRSRFSKRAGDGGIMPGNLVFSEDLEKYTGESLDGLLKQIIPEGSSPSVNVGGPCVVAMIHASQLLHHLPVGFSCFGAIGTDNTGKMLRSLIGRTSIGLDHYDLIEGATPKTVVLSDPDYHHGEGERAFINTIGVAADYMPERLDPCFFDADILLFGGTALVPPIHDHLFELLKKGKRQGSVNVVTTVFDFRNENLAPHRRWPLGGSDDGFRHIDLLIMDQEEALRISGEKEVYRAAGFFMDKKTRSFIITRGPGDILLYSDGTFFAPHSLAEIPVLPIKDYKTTGMKSDTTGCGDNFSGGVISSLVTQMMAGERKGFDLAEACSWGIASGTYTGLITGGVEFEKRKGEKLEKITRLYQDYKERMAKG
jgi:sugar/nucleoside kinase (ribokinase family)